MATKIQVRRDSAANWSNENPQLNAGEFGYDTTNNTLKVGDGTTRWNTLKEVVDTDYEFDENPAYLRTAAGTFDQTVQSTGTTTFSGSCEFQDIKTGSTEYNYFYNSTGTATLDPGGSGLAIGWNDGQGSRETNFINLSGQDTNSLVVQGGFKFQSIAKDGTESPIVRFFGTGDVCLLYTSPSPRDRTRSRMPSSA